MKIQRNNFRVPDEDFSIQYLADVIEDTVGTVGLIMFSLGFMAAAVSSMITVALGAAITADSMFTIKKENGDQEGREKHISIIK